MLTKVNTIIVNQPHGLGDIIFIQTILNKLVKDGYNVILPVVPIYENIQKHFPNIKIINKDKLKKVY